MCWIEPEEFVDGHSQHFTDEIVQSHIDRSLYGGVEPNNVLQVIENILDDKWVVTKVACKLTDTCQHCLHVLAIKFVRGRLTIARMSVEVDLDNRVRCYVLHST